MSTTGDDRWAGPLVASVDNNLWQLWITARTGLTPDSRTPAQTMRCHSRMPCYGGCASVGLYPAATGLRDHAGRHPVAGIAALCLSATANRQLLRRSVTICTGFMPSRRKNLSPNPSPVGAERRCGHARWVLPGREPLRLGLGLYPGERIRQPVYAPFATGIRLSKKWK